MRLRDIQRIQCPMQRVRPSGSWMPRGPKGATFSLGKGLGYVRMTREPFEVGRLCPPGGGKRPRRPMKGW